MWNLNIDYTKELARQFLLKDFLKVVCRTRFLYVETNPPKDIGHGLFEPITLSLCWCDFLGALYCGDGNLGNTERSKAYITEVLGGLNPRYKSAAKHLVKTYRNGPVHAFAPQGNFSIHLDNKKEHLARQQNPYCLVVSVRTLVEDMEQSVKTFADHIEKVDDPDKRGSLSKFNQARRDLQKYVGEK